MRTENMKNSLKIMVPGAGIEPARPYGREILSLEKSHNLLILLCRIRIILHVFDPFASLLRHSISKLLLHLSMLCVACLMFGYVQADELQIVLGSHHFNKDKQKTYNESNFGLIYTKSLGESGFSLIGGVYRNTYDRNTVLAGGEYAVKLNERISAGAQMGLGTGYEEISGSPVTPIGSFFGQIKLFNDSGIRITFIPQKSLAVGLSVVVEIGSSR